MTNAEIKKAVDTQLDSLGKLIKALEDSTNYDVAQNLRQAFEYLLAASMKARVLLEKPAAPKPTLMRRSLF